MKTARLPGYICDDLDKANRNFLWGSSERERKVHLVNWNVVCKPKRLGDLGIKRAASMNQALLAKASWRIANNHDGLWADMMRKKYLRGTTSLANYNLKSNCASSTWKGIIHGAEILNTRMKWRVGNGQKIKFWTQPWVLEGALIDSTYAKTEVTDTQEVVADYLTINGWNIGKLLEVLDLEAVQKITSIHADFEGMVPDSFVWRPSPNGEFTVQSAYSICCGLPQTENASGYDMWKLKIPPKVKVFMWLLAQNKILTNVQRKRRKLTNITACPICHYHLESLQHLFILCPRAQAIWNSFSLPDDIRNSFYADFNSWLKINLKANYCNSNNLRWCNIFATVCWFIWKWRCSTVFDSSFRYPEVPKERILGFLGDWNTANKIVSNISPMNQIWLAWKPPPDSSMKLNIDGSRIGSSGRIAAGGLIRNSTGDWAAGFSANIGHGEVLIAELWALYHGLQIAKVEKLIVETDSVLILHMMNRSWEPNHPLLVMLTKCKSLWKSSWECCINHVYREANFAADCLAKMGHELNLGVQLLETPPGGIFSILEANRCGFMRARLLSV